MIRDNMKISKIITSFYFIVISYLIIYLSGEYFSFIEISQLLRNLLIIFTICILILLLICSFIFILLFKEYLVAMQKLAIIKAIFHIFLLVANFFLIFFIGPINLDIFIRFVWMITSFLFPIAIIFDYYYLLQYLPSENFSEKYISRLELIYLATIIFNFGLNYYFLSQLSFIITQSNLFISGGVFLCGGTILSLLFITALEKQRKLLDTQSKSSLSGFKYNNPFFSKNLQKFLFIPLQIFDICINLFVFFPYFSLPSAGHVDLMLYVLFIKILFFILYLYQFFKLNNRLKSTI